MCSSDLLLPSAHAVDREYRLIAGLHPTGFPVAKPYGLCEDDNVVGSAFYIMELVEGATYWDGALPDKTPEQRSAIYYEICDRLAQLHNTDYEAARSEEHTSELQSRRNLGCRLLLEKTKKTKKKKKHTTG